MRDWEGVVEEEDKPVKNCCDRLKHTFLGSDENDEDSWIAGMTWGELSKSEKMQRNEKMMKYQDV